MDYAAALPVARQYLQAKGVSESVRRHFDIMAGHFYIGVVKSSYQLPSQVGQRVRASIRDTFTENLFSDCAGMLAFTRGQETRSTTRGADLHMIAQVRNALSGNLIFHWSQTASRKLKVMRQARKLRKYHQSLAAAKA